MWVKNCIIEPSFQNKSEYSICIAFPFHNKNPFATEGPEMLASKYVQGGNRRPEKLSRTDQTAEE